MINSTAPGVETTPGLAGCAGGATALHTDLMESRVRLPNCIMLYLRVRLPGPFVLYPLGYVIEGATAHLSLA